MNELDPTLPPSKPDRYLPRAEWQRTVNAVFLRELFEDTFHNGTAIEGTDLGEILEKERMLAAIRLGFGDLWRFAYATLYVQGQKFEKQVMAHPMMEHFTAVDKVPPGHLAASLDEFTYNRSPEDIVRESIATSYCFPLNLIRSLQHASYGAEQTSYRFYPRSLTEIAEIIESSDVRTMIDEALVTANESWDQFSVGYSDFAPTILWQTHPRFVFSDGKVAWSEKALKVFHSRIKTNNSHLLKQFPPRDEPNAISSKSTSGCPARYTKIQITSSRHYDELQWIAEVMGKKVEDFSIEHEQSLVQLSVTAIAAALKSANAIVMPSIHLRERQIRDRLELRGYPQIDNAVERAIYSA